MFVILCLLSFMTVVTRPNAKTMPKPDRLTKCHTGGTKKNGSSDIWSDIPLTFSQKVDIGFHKYHIIYVFLNTEIRRHRVICPSVSPYLCVQNMRPIYHSQYRKSRKISISSPHHLSSRSSPCSSLSTTGRKPSCHRRRRNSRN